MRGSRPKSRGVWTGNGTANEENMGDLSSMQHEWPPKQNDGGSEEASTRPGLYPGCCRCYKAKKQETLN